MADQTVSRLERLPVELILDIASYLPAADVGALRLTSRAMYHKRPDFFARFFHTKQFWFDESSLQALVDMSAHPTISRELKHVALGLDHVDFEWTLRESLGKGSLTPAQRRQVYNWLARFKHLQSSGADIDMLAEAFASLPNLDTLSIRDFNMSRTSRFKMLEYSDMHLYWDDLDTFHSYGMKAARRATGNLKRMKEEHPSAVNESRRTVQHIFAKVLAALAKSGARPRALEVLMPEQYWDIRDEAFCIPTSMRPTLVPVLSTLTKLHLDLCIGWRGEENFLREFLSLVPRLTWLRLGLTHCINGDRETCNQLLTWLGSPSDGEDGASSEVQGGRFPHLQHLEIKGADVSFDALTRPILRHSGTLRKLTLRAITMRTPPPGLEKDRHEASGWPRFLRFLAHRTRLLSFRLSRPSAPGRIILPPPPSLTGIKRVRFGGSKHVNSSDPMKLFLTDLADNMQTLWYEDEQGSDDNGEGGEGGGEGEGWREGEGEGEGKDKDENTANGKKNVEEDIEFEGSLLIDRMINDYEGRLAIIDPTVDARHETATDNYDGPGAE